MRLLYVVTPAQYFLSHRLGLARAAAAAGWDVHVAVPAGQEQVRIREAGLTPHEIDLCRSIGTPQREMRSFAALVRLIRRLRPDLVHAVSPKAAVLGGLAARLLGCRAVIMKGGLGSTATERGWANSLARTAIRLGIRMGVTERTTLIVQNPDELSDLAGTDRIRRRAVTVPGAGVNCSIFTPTPEPPLPVTVVLPARMLRSKGIPEFVEAGRILARRRVKVRMLLAGGTDAVNSSGISAAEIESWQREGVVDWLRHRTDMPDVLARSHIVCLPSHGEGLPKSLTEAAAAARPMIASDVPGCREVVIPGRTGLLVPARDPARLADALELLIGDPAMRSRFGSAARRLALERFDEHLIHKQMLTVYSDLHRPVEQ